MNDTLPGAGVWADEDVVTLAALRHHVYCPRQCALIHVEQVWTENLYTLVGGREACLRQHGTSRYVDYDEPLIL